MNVRPCIDAQRYEAPTGRKGIAQGKAKRRPGFRDVIKSRALKGRNRRCVSRAMMFRPFRALANWGGVPPRVALRSTLGYLIMPLWGERSGYGTVLIAHCRRSKLCWVIRDGVC